MTEQQPRNKKKEQLGTVSRAMSRNGIELEHKEAAQTLLQSINQAKSRVGKAPGYEDKKFLLEEKPREALIQIINVEPAFWETWTALQKQFKASGYDEKHRPNMHRIDSEGHYESGNIEALSDEMHKLKHAKPVAIMIVKNGKLGFKIIETQIAAQKELDVSSTKLNRMKSQPYDLAIKNEAGDLINTGKQIFAMPSYDVTRAEFLQMEIERLEQDKAEYGLEGVNTDFINEKIVSYKEQIADPVAMKTEQDRQDKVDYIRTVGSIARFDALPADKVETGLLAGLRQKKIIFEANGYHLL